MADRRTGWVCQGDTGKGSVSRLVEQERSGRWEIDQGTQLCLQLSICYPAWTGGAGDGAHGSGSCTANSVSWRPESSSRPILANCSPFHVSLLSLGPHLPSLLLQLFFFHQLWLLPLGPTTVRCLPLISALQEHRTSCAQNHTESGV